MWADLLSYYSTVYDSSSHNKQQNHQNFSLKNEENLNENEAEEILGPKTPGEN